MAKSSTPNEADLARRGPDIHLRSGSPFVGVLTGDEPRTPGLWKYEPYRGMGHVAFLEELRKHGQAECRAEIEEAVWLAFTVTDELFDPLDTPDCWKLVVSAVSAE